MDLKETAALGEDIDQHWYYRSKALALRRLLAPKLSPSILDVGAGSGFFSRHLLKHTDAKEAHCVDTGYLSDKTEHQSGKNIHFHRTVESMDVGLVLFMDVLEHVEDDLALLSYYSTLIPVGTQILITVPAFNFLWSAHDVFLEHKRRYTLKQIESLIRDANWEVEAGVYFFGMVLPLAIIIRFAERVFGGETAAKSQLKRHHPIINKFLYLLCALEMPFMRYNRMAGLSILCLARKSK